MNTESLNHHLITKVLDYDYAIEGESGEGVYTHKDGDHIYTFLWDPRNNIKQADACLDNFTLWSVEKCESEDGEVYYTVYVEHFDKRTKGEAVHADKELAISLACAKATGYEE